MKSAEDYPEVFDTIIIGAGPAGMTAAVYAARRKMKALLICGKVGGQMMWSSDIENYTGIAQATGPDMTKEFFNHVRKVDDDNEHFDLWVRENEKVVTIIKNEKTDIFEVTTSKNRVFLSYTIVIASGKIPRTLNIIKRTNVVNATLSQNQHMYFYNDTLNVVDNNYNVYKYPLDNIPTPTMNELSISPLPVFLTIFALTANLPILPELAPRVVFKNPSLPNSCLR